MAMDKDVLANAIANAVANENDVDVTQSMIDNWTVIAEEIINHLINYAEVSVDSVSGVVSGSENSGPGSGSISS